MPVSQKLPCVVERIVSHGERVYTIALRPDRPAPRFRAGQFLHLALDPYDPSGFWPESRVSVRAISGTFAAIRSPSLRTSRARSVAASPAHFGNAAFAAATAASTSASPPAATSASTS